MLFCVSTALLTHIPQKNCHVFGEIYEHLPPDKQDLEPLRVLSLKSSRGFQIQGYLYLLLETYEHLPPDKQNLEPADNNKQVCRKTPTIDTYPL